MPKAKVDLSGVQLGDVVLRFLESKKPSTGVTYEKCLKRFNYFHEAGLKSFIGEIEEEIRLNQGRSLAERVRPGEDTIRKFIAWHKEVGYSNNSTRQGVAAVQNFLKFYGVTISSDFIELPPARPMKGNDKHKWTLEEMRKFVDVARYLRDKAFITICFQSGLGIGDVVNLDYRDVRKGLEKGQLPLLLQLYRGKTGVEFKTFLGRDAVHQLRAYLKTRGPLKNGDPLFTMLGNEQRVSGGAIDHMLKKYAKKLDFIHEEDLENGYNPARSHSLRTAFRSRLTGKMDGTLIEFFMGHDIGEEKRTYINLPDSDLSELYMNYEYLLSLEKTCREELEELGPRPLPEETLTLINNLEITVSKLSLKNTELERKYEDRTLGLERKLEAQLETLEEQQRKIELMQPAFEMAQRLIEKENALDRIREASKEPGDALAKGG